LVLLILCACLPGVPWPNDDKDDTDPTDTDTVDTDPPDTDTDTDTDLIGECGPAIGLRSPNTVCSTADPCDRPGFLTPVLTHATDVPTCKASG